MSENAIELRGLRKTYAATKKMSAKTALDGINLDIPRGSIFGLLGPNGAGKSTLIAQICGELKPNAGRIELLGQDVTHTNTLTRAKAGIGRTF